MTTPPPGDCAECQRPLSSLTIKHGWISVFTGWRFPNARVHTICKRKFQQRELAEQQGLARRQHRSL